MKRTRIAAALALAAATSATLPAFADVIERTTTYYYVPSNTTTYVEPAATTTYVAPPSSADYYTPPLGYYYEPGYSEPQVVRVYEAPAITVTAPYMNEDQAITSDVMDAIASNPRISGAVGVETRDRDVHLNGLVTTPGQARMAERDARSVDGVRNVDNGIRTKVGGSY